MGAAPYNYRFYPRPAARQALARSFGCARVVYNDGLRLRNQAYEAGEKYIPSGELQKRVITAARHTEERAWLANVSHTMLQQAVRDLDGAFRRFFDSKAGKLPGPRVGHPRFRSLRDRRQSIRFTRSDFRVLRDGRVHLGKIGNVEVRWSRPLPAPPSSVTVVLDRAGRYFLSFVVEVDVSPLPETETEVGIDLGLTHFAVLSDGTKITAPRFLRRAERRLRKAQQNLSRKAKGSTNREKARARLARQHARIADTRRDWHHKLSTRIVRENQAVFVEDLAVHGLGRTRLAKSVHDAGWGQFLTMLEYKAQRHARTFGRIGRFVPSTRVCSACGINGGAKPMAVRAWTCGSCQVTHDRDINAAKNILAAGRADSRNASGGQVRPGLIPAQPGERGTSRTKCAQGVKPMHHDHLGQSAASRPTPPPP
ncbi:RNA-guided endonuclease InsQ/TnpB family protein [Streptomyces sp. NPDC056387]|uniref:RNA-guided endonuclease InsQ/TnpB family protein n=1 Tax=Streptomyces sp. NPDC056387 TaxID=3345803 RepID=UPI0035E24148